MKKKYIWVAVVLIIGGGYYWYSNSKTSIKAVQYKTTAAEKSALTVSVAGSGQVEAVSQVDLKPVVAGDAIEVIRVYVTNDQAVKKGDMIALLDTQDAQKAVRNAELDLASAKNKYTQTKKSDTADKYDEKAQKLTVEQKENSLADARAELSDYYVRAPFGGVVTSLSVSPGDSVSRSDILASIITNDVQAKVVLNEIDAVQVKVGDKATLKFDALPETSITGKVTKIDTLGTVSQGVVSYNAEIAFDLQNDLLKPGMSVAAKIITDIKQEAVVVPNGAVKTQDNVTYVEILQAGAQTPERRGVEIGLANNTETEIVNGISVGDNVVVQTIDPNIKATTPTPGIFGSGGRSGVGALR